ncbi:UDP-2,3-diacylglucosamine diphosphatase [Psychromonas sp.]|uniref:UDP-2,3-diacylglucosamine diphosphatase n=1 Tax=Psychromonas sp. TaxID=1884585 RepID=UPI0035660F3F
MRTLFIADLHLSENHPQVCTAFFNFLQHETENVQALYILGDLFEVWIGDDEHTPLMDEVALKLSAYASENNIQVYYIHGNRDFMLGKKFARQSSMQLLPEHCEIDLYGNNTLILHGDTLCLADKNYQKMRKVIHNPILQLLFNLLPLSLRKKIGWKIRTASQSKKVYKNREIMGVTEDEVKRLMEKHNTQTLIHGHTHQVACHNMSIKGKPAQRYDVGDWYTNLSYVEAQQDKIELVIRPIDYYDNDQPR